MGEEMSENKDSLLVQFRGHHLDKKDFLGSSDPFIVLYRQAIENNQYMAVHKTEVWEYFLQQQFNLTYCSKSVGSIILRMLPTTENFYLFLLRKKLEYVSLILLM